MTKGTRIQALIIALPNRGPIPGLVKCSIGPIKLIQSHNWSTIDFTRSGFDDDRNALTTEWKGLIKTNGHLLVGNPRVVKIETRNEVFEVTRERRH